MAQSTVRARVPHLPSEPNPALVKHAEERAQSVQNRTASMQVAEFTPELQLSQGG